MGRMILNRLAWFVVVMIGITFLTNAIIYLIPGDPVDTLVGQSATEEERAHLREELGLDEPFVVQYGTYLNRLLHGDLGRSYLTRRPVAESIAEKFPKTMELALAAMIVAVVFGVSAGIISAVFHRRTIDTAALILAVLGISSPVFITGLALRYLFADRLAVLPAAGYGEGAFLFLVLPAVTLGSRSAAYLARITRASLLEVFEQDYIRTARAKGLSQGAVILKHAMANALLPLITLVGIDFANYLSGSVITETIFDWPGLGRFALDAILRRDIPSLQGVVLVMALVFALSNLAVDLLYLAIDPRLRRSGEEGAT